MSILTFHIWSYHRQPEFYNKKARKPNKIESSDLLLSSERGIRTLDTTGMNRVL